MNQNDKKLILEAIDALNDIFLAQMGGNWEDEELWNQLAEIRTHVLIARERTASLP